MFTSGRAAAEAESKRSFELCQRAASIASSPESVAVGSGSMAYGPDRAAQESLSHYQGHVYTSSRPIAERCSAQPWRLARAVPRGKRLGPGEKGITDAVFERSAWLRTVASDDPSSLVLVDQHPILDSLSRPNRFTTDFDLKSRTVLSLLLTGWAFWWFEKVKGRLECWHLPTHQVRPKHEGRLFSGWKVYSANDTQGRDVPEGEIVPFWFPSPLGITTATCPLQANLRAVVIDEMIQQAQERAFRQGIMPGLAVIVGEQTGKGGIKSRPRLNKRHRQQLRNAVNNRMRGLGHWYEPLIFDQVISDVKKISNNPAEMDFNSSSQISQSRVERAFGSGKAQTGAIDGMTYGAVGASDALFVANTVNPILDRMGRTATAFVVPMFEKRDDTGLFLYLEPAVPNDHVQRFNEYKASLASGTVTVEEYRTKILSLPPKPKDGETLLMPMGVQQVIVGAPPPEPQPAMPPPQPAEAPAEEGGSAVPTAASFRGDQVVVAKSLVAKSSDQIDQNDIFGSGFKGMLIKAWTKKADSREDRFVEVMREFFSQQAREVARRLPAINEDTDPAAAARRALVVSKWNKKLRREVGVWLVETLAEGAKLELNQVAKQRYFGTKELTPDDLDIEVDLPPEVLDGVIDHANDILEQDYWDDINETTVEKVSRAIRDGIEDGDTRREIAARVHVALGDEGDLARARLIARTEATGALNAGHQEARDYLVEEGIVEGKVWMATIDERTRDTHLEMDEVEIPNDEPFVLPDGEEAMYPGAHTLSAENRCNCILPGALVEGEFDVAMRSSYSGQAVEIITRSGRRLSLTPNHPVLTKHGLVAAGQLQRGDQVVAYDGQVDSFPRAGACGDQVDDVPTTIEKVFETFMLRSILGGTSTVEVRRANVDDFHGDGKFIEGEIEIVRPNGELLVDGEPNGFKERSDDVLHLEDAETTPIDGQSGFRLFGLGLNSSSGGVPCATTLPFDGGTITLERAPFESFRVGLAAEINASLRETTVDRQTTTAVRLSDRVDGHPVGVLNDDLIDVKREPVTVVRELTSGESHSPIQRVALTPTFLGELFNRYSRVVFVDEIVDVRKFEFRGHVYDLQSVKGWIVANGLFTSNCRCLAAATTVFSKSVFKCGGPGSGRPGPCPSGVQSEPGGPGGDGGFLGADKERVASEPSDEVVAKLTEWEETVDAEEFSEAVNSYTQDGFKKLNMALRRGETVPEDMAETDEVLREMLNAAGESEVPVLVYRGVSMGEENRAKFLAAARASAENGDELVVKSYSSTSLNSDIVHRFGNVALEIKAKRGAYIGGLSRSPREREFLIGPGERFRVKAVLENVAFRSGNKTTTRTVVQMEQL